MHFEFFSLEIIQEWIQQYGYWIVFFGIMLENAGIPLPGETITLVGGFLAGNGELRYPLLLLSAVAGAILGDSAGYWLGRWGGLPALEKVGKLFRMPTDEIAIAREKFRSSADRAVFFGRFIAILRIFAGPMAGLSGMSYSRFLFFNATGALVWGTVTTGVAYYAGTLIPLETLVSGVVRISSIILSGILLWFAAPPAFFWLKERISNWRSPNHPQPPKPNHSNLQSASESPVLVPITEDKVAVKLEKE
ncbi:MULTISPECIES: DedA family protein [Pseudanabaena]|uniref:SNARE associated Golgi family protein n=2 Tax=Pseudanabaena TaxID=1152 RepID=L8N394_9CYAN|nr:MULTISPECIES: DedA family protein [Pseudanabaena]ELS33185.1 SNARE associated Golgi family protein [Pseudanabaena biceps PCC 7429]MDG3494615.1 DedA family protein [Pseudanabaena catenata USMAC16]